MIRIYTYYVFNAFVASFNLTRMLFLAIIWFQQSTKHTLPYLMILSVHSAMITSIYDKIAHGAEVCHSVRCRAFGPAQCRMSCVCVGRRRSYGWHEVPRNYISGIPISSLWNCMCCSSPLYFMVPCCITIKAYVFLVLFRHIMGPRPYRLLSVP